MMCSMLNFSCEDLWHAYAERIKQNNFCLSSVVIITSPPPQIVHFNLTGPLIADREVTRDNDVMTKTGNSSSSVLLCS